MSFNRLNYDTCEYKQSISQSIGPGHYQINTPPISCEPCYPYSPSIRLQHSGNSVDLSKYMIDIDSELIGITTPASKCPSKKYIPNIKNGKICIDNNQHNWKDCSLPAEETRTSNPPCNLRGTGINRWEWLCLNPQDRIESPFDSQVQTRIVVKDNHRPCVPTPIDPTVTLPRGGTIPCETVTPSVCTVPTNPPSVHWRKCQQIRDY